MQERIPIEWPFRARRIFQTIKVVDVSKLVTGREHEMVSVRERNPETLRRSVRATGYVRISAEKPLNSGNNQKAASRRYAKTQKLHVALICSDQRRVKGS